MVSKRFVWRSGVVCAAAALAFVGIAHASGITRKVERAFKGQILLTKDGLPAAGASDKATIKKFKDARITSVTRADNGSSTPWTFTYTAFLKKRPLINRLSFDFYTRDKAANYVANKRIGINGRERVIAGNFELTEDDGLKKGGKYVLKLTAEIKGRDYVFAKTTIDTN